MRGKFARTCLVVERVFGECLKIKKCSTSQVAFQTAYNKRDHNKKVFKGMTIMARQTLQVVNEKQEHLCKAKDCNAKIIGKKISYRQATVERFHHKDDVKIITREPYPSLVNIVLTGLTFVDWMLLSWKLLLIVTCRRRLSNKQ